MSGAGSPWTLRDRGDNPGPACTGTSTPHLLRHTFATRLLDAAADLREVQEIRGHDEIATTVRYTQASSARLRRAVLQLARQSAPSPGG